MSVPQDEPLTEAELNEYEALLGVTELHPGKVARLVAEARRLRAAPTEQEKARAMSRAFKALGFAVAGLAWIAVAVLWVPALERTAGVVGGVLFFGAFMAWHGR